MTNSTEPLGLGQPSAKRADNKLSAARPDWVPSRRGLVAIRASLIELDRSTAAMRAVPPLGEPDFDDAWSDLTEAYQALTDRIRVPLDAEDWPGLASAVIEARASFRAVRDQDNIVQGKICDVLAATIEETEAKIAARSNDALVGGAA